MPPSAHSEDLCGIAVWENVVPRRSYQVVAQSAYRSLDGDGMCAQSGTEKLDLEEFEKWVLEGV